MSHILVVCSLKVLPVALSSIVNGSELSYVICADLLPRALRAVWGD